MRECFVLCGRILLSGPNRMICCFSSLRKLAQPPGSSVGAELACAQVLVDIVSHCLHH